MTKHHRRPRRSRLRRNAEGDTSLVQRVVVPALVGAGGMVLASWLSNNVSARLLPGQDPKLLMLVTGAAGSAAALAMGESAGMNSEISAALATGMGIAAVMPYLSGLTGAAAQSSPSLPANTMSGLADPMIDVAHYGAPYQGMLGLGSLPQPPGVSTIIPHDLAFKAKFEQQVKRVRTPFTAADHGYAGGVFARQLFSGMTGG